MKVMRREDWTDDPLPRDVMLFDPDSVEGVAVHWPGGAGSVPTDARSVVQLLQAELRYHTEEKHWSDIAYNFAIDNAGRCWDLRGPYHRSAANGDQVVNARFLAVTCLIGPRDTPSPELVEAFRGLRRGLLKIYPRAGLVAPHSAVRPRPTLCPGDALRALIADGTLTMPASPAELREEPTMIAYAVDIAPEQDKDHNSEPDEYVFREGRLLLTGPAAGCRQLVRLAGGPATEGGTWADYVEARVGVVHVTAAHLRSCGYVLPGDPGYGG